MDAYPKPMPRRLLLGLISLLTGTLAVPRMAHSQNQWAGARADLIDSRTERQKNKGAVGYKASPEGRDAVLEAVACWRRSSLTMHPLCAARGIRSVHILQPTLHNEGSKVMAEEERRVGIDDEGLHPIVVRGYPLLREALAELREMGVEALDACSAFKEMPQTIYVDSCHVTQEGNRILARNIARMMGLPEPPDKESDSTKDK